jgi:large subunit ribosomal protein L32e
MAVPLLTAKIVKKRTKHFKRAHSDRYIGLKVSTSHPELLPTGIRMSGYFS